MSCLSVLVMSLPLLSLAGLYTPWDAASAGTTQCYDHSRLLCSARSTCVTTPSRAFGKRLREAREDLRLSQAALAAALGITQAAVSNWEAGLRQPSLDDLYAVAGVLGV